MKEQMFSCIDKDDGCKTMLWVRGNLCAISHDIGENDPWKTTEDAGNFEDYRHMKFKKSQFKNMKLIWEREK